MTKNEDIAIIGLAAVFPGAGDIKSYWNNIREGRDAIRTVPEQRIAPTYFEAGAPAPDRFYCGRGGFIDDYATFDPLPYGLLPLAVEGMEPEQLLSLQLAHQALNDAGFSDDQALLDKTAIIIGKGNYAGPGTTRAIEITHTSEQLVRLLRELLPQLSGSELDQVKKEFQQKQGRFAADTAMGLIPNLTASLAANRLGLGGAAYTIDAACASSLIAVDHAVRELQNGRADSVLAGGVHAGQNAPFWSIFSQLGALSKSQQIRPFDRRADGLLIGEGCGFVVLRRLKDALKSGHRIYAVIKGVGVASDGGGTSVMSPSVGGQKRAIRQAWENAGIDMETIGYLEAHGTGTPLGDQTEIATLTSLFHKPAGKPKAGLGSVKSMIGHTMPAAGMAGLIKASLALYHETLPPTLHCEQPLKQLEESAFQPIHKAQHWQDSGLPLVAGVNAFGFGGINAHVVLTAWDRDEPATPLHRAAETEGRIKPLLRSDSATPVLVAPILLARSSGEALIAALESNDDEPGAGTYRMAIFNPTAERIQKAIRIIRRDKPWHNKQDIWFTNRPMLLNGGRLAFLFPGLDGLSEGEVDTIAQHFNFPLNKKKPSSDETVFGRASQLLEKSAVLDKALKTAGLHPDLNAGHSLGEWQAGRASGIVSDMSVNSLLQQLQTKNFDQEHTRFVAVGTGYEALKPLIAPIPDLYLAIDNCPQQVILCGTIAAVEALTEILKNAQIFYTIMPFSSGFHSPFAEEKVKDLEQTLSGMAFLPATIPLWSATTLEAYPEQHEELSALHVRHLTHTVRFRELILKLYEQENVRCFIQVGSGGLPGFVQDTLKGKAHMTIPASSPLRSGMEQLQRVLAAVFVEGSVVDFSLLAGEIPIQTTTHDSSTATGSSTIAASSAPTGSAAFQHNSAATDTSNIVSTAAVGSATPAEHRQPLQLGTPFVSQLSSLKALSASSGTASIQSRSKPNPESNRLIRTFQDNVHALLQVQEEILDLATQKQERRKAAVQIQTTPPPPTTAVHTPAQSGSATIQTKNTIRTENTFSKALDISIESHPYLRDHALIRQKRGWPCIEDTDPVIPMTMVLELFADAATDLAPGISVRALRQVQVHKWLSVSRPFRESLTSSRRSNNLFEMKLGDYGNALLEVGNTTPIPEKRSLPIGTALSLSITPAEVYRNHLFHGPKYQGIVKVTEIGLQGIKGIIRDSGGKGALIDNAGQLFGLWLQLTLDKDRIAFPVTIEEVAFYQDYSDQAGEFTCTCSLTKLNDEFATAEILLERNGQVWAHIRGWKNRRLEIDSKLWNVSMDPEHHFLAEAIKPGIFVFNQAYKRVVSWDFILKRYFNQQEKAAIRALPIHRQKEKIISRVAAKDAIRAQLRDTNGKTCYPIEFEIRSGPLGQPQLQGAGLEEIKISIAHKKQEAVAIAVRGRQVGIDLEEILDRGPDFAEIAFTKKEQELLQGKNPAEWSTRFWVAKEAYSKFLGTGLQGNPRAFEISEIDGDCLKIENTIIHTLKYKNYIIGWTV